MCTSATASTILAQLRLALEKEQSQWAQWTRQGGLQQGDELVGLQERDGAVAWICGMSNLLGLGPDTSALAAAILDRILSTTRVQSKYIRVVALSSFYVACKICEEPEAVPLIPDLVRLAGCVCSVQELVRMERVLLKRLSWDLCLVTPFTFLELMLVISVPSEACPALALYLRPHMETLCSKVELFQIYRPSLLAAALLSVTLERQQHPQWFLVTVNLQQLLSASLEQMISCRERVVEYLWPRDCLRQLNRCNEQVAKTTDDAKVKLVKFNPFGHTHTATENSSPLKMKSGNTRKRRRRKSKCSDGSSRIKTAPEEIFIDEIYDAVHVLYGVEKYRT